MTMKTTTGRFIPIMVISLSWACADADPSTSDSTATNPSGLTFDGTTGDPTDGSVGDAEASVPGDESSESSEEGGDPPIQCNPADKHEPNEIEDEAMLLPNITDEDSAGEVIESILAGDGDIDWFAYMGSDVAFAVVDPAGGIDADMEVRLCLFVECVNGNTKPFDCADSIYDETPDRTLPGCCNSGASAYVSIDLYCDAAGDESAYVYMRVDQGLADICVPYEISYHF